MKVAFSWISILIFLALPVLSQEVTPLVPQSTTPPEAATGDSPSIVNGVLTRGAFPTVAALLEVSADPLSGRPAFHQGCSATLIGCRTVLTAAHCLCSGGSFDACRDDPDRRPAAGDIGVYLQHGGIFAVESLHIAQLYEFKLRKDVAVLRLARPVNGISPTPINEVRPPFPGDPGTISGFGLTAGGRTNKGVKRAGQVRLSRCENVPNGTHVCWNFEHPVGRPGLDSGNCNADSGGPLFTNLGGRQVVAGITSGGNEGCLPPNENFNTNVFAERAFIRRFGGTDLDNRTCGSLPQVGSPDVVVLVAPADQIFLNRAIPQRNFSLEVAPGTRQMQVGLNGRDGNGIVVFDFDVVLTSPSGAVHRSRFEPTADDDLLSAFDVITLPAPEPGTWRVVVQKGDERPNRNNGVFQLTVTLFGGGAAVQ